MFNELVVSGARGDMARTHKPWSIGLSVMIQAAILGAMLLIPLIYTQVLPKTMLTTFLVAPPPPPPPQQAVVKQVKPVKVLVVNKMSAPTVIPKKVEVVKDEAPPAVNPNDTPGVAGGTGDVLGGIGTGAAPAPPPPAAPKRITVGGNVQAAALVNKVEPQYPPIAKTAHVSGTVVLHAIIAKDGSVEKLQFVSGPALLMASAMSAVKEWRYRP
ncbi:MAG TPA: energy transducer TonB, partial [Candidatus Acidoferrales bacterium]|nr:energy transducer TonB [Candidatus Acidoferrales bacterium]